ncbi:MAG: hypothetical protein COC06_11895 [Bacteroidales bacterium]|nr:MAG: hypothetical protein COC06_11895 [Bacteroidales bacterium]
MAAIVNLQGVAETIAILDAVQQDFENLASASKLKKEAIAEINDKLIGYMNTMAKVNSATYEATAKTIAELIDKNNELVKCCRKTNEADSKLV